MNQSDFSSDRDPMLVAHDGELRKDLFRARLVSNIAGCSVVGLATVA